jgi:hypothetical protein
MALLNDGEISLGGSSTGRSINLELSKLPAAIVSLNDSDVRSLAGILSGTISLENFYGKSVYIYGQEEFTSAGTYTWVCPEGVTAVSVLCIGGGGGGDAGSDLIGVGGGGGGGGLAYRNNISVIPGQSYTIVVGAGGFGQITVNRVTTQVSTDGGQSSAFSCIATGGAKGARTAATVVIGSTADGDGGGRSGVFNGGASGGVGGSIDTSVLGFRGPGGGGAAGYTGTGGYGARGQRASGTPTSAAGFAGGPGAGGGAGGGGSAFRSDVVRVATGAGGGGVGIYGAGPNGAGGTGGSSTVAAVDGGDGSSGSFGYYGAGGGGGVGGDSRSAQDGKNGAVRIIWPGQLRAFPQTITENV